MSAEDDKQHGTGLEVRPGLVIPESELQVRYSRSGGPGGQNVNKVSTRVELSFNVRDSKVLDDEDRELLLRRLENRINRRGSLRVVSQRHRSQVRNEMEARRRMAELIAAALHVAEVRRPTRPPRAARERRMQAKHHRSHLKRSRRPPEEDA